LHAGARIFSFFLTNPLARGKKERKGLSKEIGRGRKPLVHAPEFYARTSLISSENGLHQGETGKGGGPRRRAQGVCQTLIEEPNRKEERRQTRL